MYYSILLTSPLLYSWRNGRFLAHTWYVFTGNAPIISFQEWTIQELYWYLLLLLSWTNWRESNRRPALMFYNSPPSQTPIIMCAWLWDGLKLKFGFKTAQRSGSLGYSHSKPLSLTIRKRIPSHAPPTHTLSSCLSSFPSTRKAWEIGTLSSHVYTQYTTTVSALDTQCSYIHTDIEVEKLKERLSPHYRQARNRISSIEHKSFWHIKLYRLYLATVF